MENQNQNFNQPGYNQQDYPNNNYQYQQQPKIKVPNSIGVLVLGILSILVICTCGPFLGPILGTIALILAGGGMKRYRMNPEMYTISSLKNLKAGKICAIIALAICLLWLGYILVLFIINPGDFDNSQFSRAIEEFWREIN